MYEIVVMSMRNICTYTGEYPLPSDNRLAWGSSIIPYLFVLIIDELTTYIQKVVPWRMVFVDDTVLVDKLENDVNAKLER